VRKDKNREPFKAQVPLQNIEESPLNINSAKLLQQAGYLRQIYSLGPILPAISLNPI
jgi:hypothetical protein